MPVFVITHRPLQPLADPGGSTFTFVLDGIENALAQARAAAGVRDVVVIGGAVAGRQLLGGGFVDELRLHLVHVLLGEGTRLFDLPGTGFRKFAATRVIEDAGVSTSPSMRVCPARSPEKPVMRPRRPRRRPVPAPPR